MKEEDMLKSIADFFGKAGVDSFEFVDEAGNVRASYKTNKPPVATDPLLGYGDTVRVGNRVLVGLLDKEAGWTVDFDARPVRIINYGTPDDPFMLVDDEGRQVSFNYTGAGWRRAFKVVSHG